MDALISAMIEMSRENPVLGHPITSTTRLCIGLSECSDLTNSAPNLELLSWLLEHLHFVYCHPFE